MFSKTKFKYAIFSLIILNIIRETSGYSFCDLTSLGYDPTILEVSNGKLQGGCYKVPIDDPEQSNRIENVLEWLAVPYAEPPLNENRFRRPKPSKSWSDVRDARKLPNSCVQSKISILSGVKQDAVESEDCLYLNIYAPAKVFDKDNIYNDLNGINFKNRAPIVVFFHGGYLSDVTDSGKKLDLAVYAALSNIIIVDVNYRLGPFGFLYVSGTEINGNQGFLDQNLALKWIYENAVKFGGDVNRVTVAGAGAGSILVGYHLIYEPSWKYFRNAYLSSGSIIYPYMEIISPGDATKKSITIISQLGCAKSLNSVEFYNCLQKPSTSEIVNKFSEYYASQGFGKNQYLNEFSPEFFVVQDGQVFNRSVKESFEKELFKKVNLLTGHTKDEGSIYVLASKILNQNGNLFLNNSAFRNIIDGFYKNYPIEKDSSFETFKDALINQYIVDIQQNDQTNYLSVLIKALGEDVFICPTLELAKIFTKYTSVFEYVFDHRTSSSKYSIDLGTIHGEDVSYFLGKPLAKVENGPSGFNSDDKTLSKRLVTYLSNFVKFNDPNVFDQINRDPTEFPFWPPFKQGFSPDQVFNNTALKMKGSLLKILEERLSYDYIHLVFKNGQTSVQSEYSTLKCAFWKNFNLYHV